MPNPRLKKAAVMLSGTTRFYSRASDFLYLLACQASSHPFNEIKTKGIGYFKSFKIMEAGQVEECLGQTAHEVYLVDGQVEINLNF